MVAAAIIRNVRARREREPARIATETRLLLNLAEAYPRGRTLGFVAKFLRERTKTLPRFLL